MSSNEAWQQAREDVVLFSRRMQDERLTYWTGGNVSRRVDGEPHHYAVTPLSDDDFVSSRVSNIENEVQAFVLANPWASMRQIEANVRAKRDTVRGVVAQLVQNGVFVERAGTHRSREFSVALQEGDGP